MKLSGMNEGRRAISTALLLLLFIMVACRPQGKEVPALIPMPQSVTWTGDDFQLEGNGNRMVRRLVSTLPGVTHNAGEGYLLKVSRDSVILEALTPAGLFRGEQTLNQLKINHRGRDLLAGCTITDWPAFAIRGFMQDVGRNYMSLPFLKERSTCWLLTSSISSIFMLPITRVGGSKVSAIRSCRTPPP